MALIDILQDKFGKDFHPAILLGQVVANQDKEGSECEYDIKLRVDCAKNLMPYLESARKAIEVKGEVHNDFGVLRVSLFNEEEDDNEDNDEVSLSIESE